MKRIALILALALLLASCAPRGAETGGSSGSADPSSGVETGDPAAAAQYTSELGFSITYDPTLFVLGDPADTNGLQFAMESIKEIRDFPVCFRVTILEASSVEEVINKGLLGNLDCTHVVGVRDEVIREEVTFGAGPYPATLLTYNQAYAVGEHYVTEQNGALYDVEVSSYRQPPEELLAGAYAILDSVTF